MKKVIALMIFIIFASFLSVIFYKSKAGDKKKLILKSEAERFINVFEDNKDNIVLASIKKDIFSDSSVDPNSVFKKISVTDIRFFPKETAAFVTIEIIIGKNGQRLKNIEEFDSKFISEKNYEKSKTFSANNYSEKIKI
ncbi:MAG TPA: hypothetical protein PKY81_11115, partial [bacterium]|nr:hypothetical protein [bacterium]